MAKQVAAATQATGTQGSTKGFKKPEGTENLAPLTFIKASELKEAGKTGIIAEGTYVGTMPNKFNEDKPSYKIEQEDGSILVVNSAGNLQYRMGSVKLGQLVQISYLGMEKLTKGKFAGKESHQFDVLVAE